MKICYNFFWLLVYFISYLTIFFYFLEKGSGGDTHGKCLQPFMCFDEFYSTFAMIFIRQFLNGGSGTPKPTGYVIG